MNTENNALIANLLALSVKDGNKFDFTSAGMYALSSEYIDGADVDAFFMDTEEDVDAIFFNLSPDYNYQGVHIEFEDMAKEFTCQCFSDGNQLVTTVQSDSLELPLSYIGSYPSNSKRFPQAGYLTIALLKERLKDQPTLLSQALKSLFKAIGEVCYPTSKAPAQQAEKIYVKDLEKHAKKGTFPLKGAPIQQGYPFFMNGEEYVFTAYGVAKMVGNFYGEMVLDTAVSFEDNAGCHIIRIATHCNNEKKAQNSIVTIEDYQEDKLPSMNELGDIPKVMLDAYGDSVDFDLCCNLGTAARSVVHSNHTGMNYFESWNHVAFTVKTTFETVGFDGFTFEKVDL